MPAAMATGVYQVDPNPFNLENPAILDIAPAEPKSLEDAGLKMGLLADIALQATCTTRAAPPA